MRASPCAQRRISSLLFGESLRDPVSPFGAARLPLGCPGARWEPGTGGEAKLTAAAASVTAPAALRSDQQGPGAEESRAVQLAGAWCWACLSCRGEAAVPHPASVTGGATLRSLAGALSPPRFVGHLVQP